MPGGFKKLTAKDGKPFKKGDQRINRKGRPKKLPALDTLLIDVLGENVKGKDKEGNAYSFEAMKGILLALRKRAFSGDVQAATLLMDRAYGKLKTSNELELNIKKLTDEQLSDIIERLFK